MKTSPRAEHEAACTRIAALFEARWLRIYVAKKLRSDPVYEAVFELLRASEQPLLDVGCGVGLLAFYLRERGFAEPITGVDSDERKTRRAKEAAHRQDDGLQFAHADARAGQIVFRGNVAVLDLLHYLAPNDQRALLLRLAAQVAPGGVLLIRDCPRSRSMRFCFTLLAERFAQAISWNLATPLHFASSHEIASAFDPAEFTSEVRPLWGRTPFNNHLFIFRRRAVAPVAE